MREVLGSEAEGGGNEGSLRLPIAVSWAEEVIMLLTVEVVVVTETALGIVVVDDAECTSCKQIRKNQIMSS